jgi:hypothetical protein
MQDKIGQAIVPGCIIAYGHNLDRCAGIRLGKVLKTNVDIDQDYYLNNPYMIKYQGHADRLTYRITVWGISDDFEKTPELLSKRSTLQFPDRCVVVPFDSLPQKYKDLFDEVK